MLVNFKSHSDDYRDLDVTQLSGQLLDIAERRVHADAIAASARPIAEDGELVERRVRDQSGRERIEFYGKPGAWMDQFKQIPYRAKINRPRSDW